jgi:hypothetical protein
MSPKILDRIHKLLEKVRPGANTTEEEARTAAHMVCRFIIEHKLVLALPAGAGYTPPPETTSTSWSQVRRAEQERQRAARVKAEQERIMREAAERHRAEQERKRAAEQQQRAWSPFADFEWNNGTMPPWWASATRPGAGVEGQPDQRHAPPPPRDPFVDALNGDLRRKMEEHERHQAEKAKRAREAAAREAAAGDPDYDGPDPKEFSGAELEWRQRRHRAWKAASKPMREVFNEDTGEIREIPDYRGLSW